MYLQNMSNVLYVVLLRNFSRKKQEKQHMYVPRYAKLEKYDIQLRIRIQTLAIIPTICAEYILVMVKLLGSF